MIKPSRFFVAMAAAAASACSLFISLDDLKGSSTADASPADGAPQDAPGVDTGQDSATNPDAGYFFDDFNRADNAVIGNGWIQKNADAFSLVNGTVLRGYADGGGPNYEDNIVYRPSTEDILDVEVSIEVTFDSASPTFAQVWARMPSNVIAATYDLTGYGLYVNTAWAATLCRSVGPNRTDFTPNINFPSALQPNHAYRLRLDVQGSNPVHLTGYVDDLADGGVFAQGSIDDTDTTQVTTAGSVGFSGSSIDTSQNYFYDNFTRRPL